MARAEDRARLDQPIDPRRIMPRYSLMPDDFGRTSEKIARFLGTGRYLVLQTVIVSIWFGVNIIAPLTFDKYPFIFLTLILSLQASYAAPLILLAQNRQADRDRVALEEDRAQYARALADTEFLTREIAALRVAMGDVVTRDFLRSELRAALETMDERLDEYEEILKEERDDEAPISPG